MRFQTASLAVLAASATTQADHVRPNDTSICDYYTTALLENNTAANQYTLLTLLVNTVVIGNYTKPNVGVSVPGILAPGTYNGTEVHLLPYFNGELASSNRGGKEGVSVNFLDGGGAAPLMKNMPADNESSEQYFLLTHLYQFFGSLLGCTQQGMPGFAAYAGHASMYQVHKFMYLDAAEVGYFIEQVALAGASFGVSEADLTIVGHALGHLFNYRCAPPATAIPAQGPQLQSICVADSCPLAENSTCSSYDSGIEHPKPANGSAAPPTETKPTNGTSKNGTTGAKPSPSQVTDSKAGVIGVSFAMVAAGFAVFAL